MEIRLESALSVDEATLLDMHSVLNVMNVVIYELMSLGDALKGCPEIDALTDATVAIAGTLRDPEEAYRQVANVDAYVSRVRHADPDAWVTFSIADLKESLWTVFRAIEMNSRGGYRIVNNLARHEEGDYLVHLDITSPWRDQIHMPAVFQDVMRDLLANARKYTKPGGTITAGLHCSDTELRFVVADTGRGIPPSEIQSVVEFGKRGSNTKDRPTRGAGIGLTKAYYVTRKFGGRMFIDSTGVAGEGTRIEIRLPQPAALAQSA